MSRSNKVKAVMYCRVATNHDNPFAIREQERTVHTFAKENGYTIHDIYSDNGYSGLNAERPGLQRLIADIENGKVKNILVYDESRISRCYKQSFAFEVLCMKHNVHVISVMYAKYLQKEAGAAI